MSDLATDPIRDVIATLRKERENKSDPVRSMLSQLIFSTLAGRLERQADEIERLTAEPTYRIRQEQAERIAELEAENSRLRKQLIVEEFQRENPSIDNQWVVEIQKVKADNERLRAALDKAQNMIVEQIQMVDQPLEYRRNTVKRAQVLVEALKGAES